MGLKAITTLSRSNHSEATKSPMSADDKPERISGLMPRGATIWIGSGSLRGSGSGAAAALQLRQPICANGWTIKQVLREVAMPGSPPPEKMMFQLSLRRRGISDQSVLRAMDAIPRDAFVEASDRAEAWRDTALPIACGQTISQPFVVAYMTEQLRLEATHRVLEIGAGSGYQAAVLAHLCKSVLSVERFRTLADTARARLEKLGLHNVEVMLGDGFDLPANLGAFDRIMVTAAMADVPAALTDRLELDGILIAPLGPHNGVQTLVRIRRTADGLERKPLVDVRFVPALPGIAREL
jgi:protein-L-isoaspartate(D-aspartate) O-methyltransferase